jgi:hypothetical protein
MGGSLPGCWAKSSIGVRDRARVGFWLRGVIRLIASSAVGRTEYFNAVAVTVGDAKLAWALT